MHALGAACPDSALETPRPPQLFSCEVNRTMKPLANLQTREDNLKSAQPPRMSQSWLLAAQLPIPWHRYVKRMHRDCHGYATRMHRDCHQNAPGVARYVYRITTGTLQTQEHAPIPSYECCSTSCNLFLRSKLRVLPHVLQPHAPATSVGTHSYPSPQHTYNLPSPFREVQPWCRR